jgi:hypothetical protein
MYKRFAPVVFLCVAQLFAQQAPAPELLQGIASRSPLKLQDFLLMADRNNPTLQQAAAKIRRSQAEAAQAAL